MKKLKVTYPVVWADIELPGIEPALDNGWNSVYSSPCSEVKVRTSVPATVDRADFNGFANYITSHSTYKVGVYSSAPVWNSIFGTGSAGSIPNTYEWTYLPETKTVDYSTQPTAWCLHASKTCAQFFGRPVQLEQVRADVAVVRRGRHHQQVGLRLRPDRHRADEVARRTVSRERQPAPPTSCGGARSRLARC